MKLLLINLENMVSFDRWTSNIDGRAGINSQMLQTLQEEHDKDPWQYTLCMLVIDGMSIRSEVRWNQKRGCMDGLVDLGGSGTGLDQDSISDSCRLRAQSFTRGGVR